MKEDINKGDIVNLKVDVDWVEEPDQIVVESVEDRTPDTYRGLPGSKYLIVKINASYKHSDGKVSNEVLISNLEKDHKASRDRVIDQVLSGE